MVLIGIKAVKNSFNVRHQTLTTSGINRLKRLTRRALYGRSKLCTQYPGHNEIINYYSPIAFNPLVMSRDSELNWILTKIAQLKPLNLEPQNPESGICNKNLNQSHLKWSSVLQMFAFISQSSLSRADSFWERIHVATSEEHPTSWAFSFSSGAHE